LSFDFLSTGAPRGKEASDLTGFCAAGLTTFEVLHITQSKLIGFTAKSE